jgi:hypothetical protein
MQDELRLRHLGEGHEDRDPGREIAPGRLPATARISSIRRKEAGASGAPGRDGNGVAAGAEQAVARASSSSGAPLPDDVRDRFESSLGADLSNVRVHTGAESAHAAAAVGAKAYTTGNDIHFAAGQYAPLDPFGLHLLAHEVAHTQQQTGAARGPQYKLDVSAPGDAAELEADRAADAMTSHRPATVTAGAAGSTMLHRYIPPPAPNGSAATISYPPGLLAACPSLAMAGPVEAYPSGRGALEALSQAATSAEAAKKDFDAKWAKVAGIDITSLGAADKQAINDSTKAPGSDNKARTSTEAVMTQLNQVSADQQTINAQLSQCAIDQQKLNGYSHLLKSVDADQKIAQDKAKEKKIDDSSALGIIGGLIGKLVMGVTGEAAKLLTKGGVEQSPWLSNPPTTSGTPKPQFNGTVFATMLEDGAAGLIGVIPTLIDQIRGLNSQRDALNAEIGKLQDVSLKERYAGYAQGFDAATNQLNKDSAQLPILADKLKTDSDLLKQRVADMGRDVDQKTGKNTFGKIFADAQIVKDVIAAADPYATRCQDVKAKAGAATSAAYDASAYAGMGVPPGIGLPDVTTSPPAPYDPTPLVGELGAYATHQDAEVRDAGTRKDQGDYLLQILQGKLNDAYGEAAGGSASTSAAIAPTTP